MSFITRSMEFQPKLVDTFHYHLWTDALHMRALAHQARNRWDRGTYVRFTLIAAWTTLEMACDEALETNGIGRRFQDNLKEEVAGKNLPKLNWSQGIWQEVSALQKLRIEFVHQGISDRNRFAEAKQADAAIDVCRRAIKAIYVHAGQVPPEWVDDNSDRGFQEESRFGVGNLISTGPGVDPNDPDTIRIALVYKDEERITQHCEAGTDYKPLLDELIRKTRVPISAVRAYRGNDLLEERELLMRGN
ncbi:MAG: hypothetical protein IT541_15655 [Hyphomicrobiales bacterium]|nr:hypothetical protein [Hyphomicrobiales bacterium]